MKERKKFQFLLDRKMAAIGEEEGRRSSRRLQLTDLPDKILIRILLLLPTEDAVRTCLLVLRSGQHHLWKSLTSLQFHVTTSKFSRKSRFGNFVDRVMRLRDHSSPLVSFSLQYYAVKNEADALRVKTWIKKAVQCNIEELTLQTPDCADDVMIMLPNCLFGCRSLVKLDIELISLYNDSSDIWLPRLRYLRLSQVRSAGDKSVEKLFSSPLLEELIIDKCYWSNQSIRACSPKLQVLKISDKCNSVYDFGRCSVSKICIIGDNLKYFSYMGGLLNEYRICASTQLSEVEIYVNESSSFNSFEDIGSFSSFENLLPSPRGRALNYYKILKGLSGTRNLTVSDYFLEGLQNSLELLDTIPRFEAVTQLNVGVYKEAICIDSLALMKMYERCPHLRYHNIGNLSLAVRSPQLSPIPLCLRTHLKKIWVHHYVPGDEADAAVDMLLNSAIVLEKLVIYCKRDKRKGFNTGGRKIRELQDRLNRRPRVSKDCIIKVR